MITETVTNTDVMESSGISFKKFIIGSIAGGIVYFLCTWVSYASLLNDIMIYYPGSGRSAIRLGSLLYPTLLGDLCLGFLMTYLLLLFKINALNQGMKWGAAAGFLVACAKNTIIWSHTNMYSKLLLFADVFSFTIISMIAGMAIAIFADMNNSAEIV